MKKFYKKSPVYYMVDVENEYHMHISIGSVDGCPIEGLASITAISDNDGFDMIGGLKQNAFEPSTEDEFTTAYNQAIKILNSL